MKVCTCVLLLGIFGSTNSMSRIKPRPAPKLAPERKSNAVENSREIDSSDNIHWTTVSDENKNMKLVFRAPNAKSFTDFIQETVDILNVYDDDDFQDFFKVLEKEIRKYHYEGCKFSELTQNRDTRSLLVLMLKMIRGKSVTFTKANINEVADMLRIETYDESVKELLHYINSLYKNSKHKFHRVLRELNHYRKKSKKTYDDLVQLVRDGVRTILFNHYTNLDTNTRTELKERIEIFWEKFKKSPVSNNEIDTDPEREPVSTSSEISDSVMYDVKESKFHHKMNPKRNLQNKRERIVSKETFEHTHEKDVSRYSQSGTQTSWEFSSGQSFDSSSNSIKHSQERHEEYNTQRYMTLYTEEISYKAMTTPETETPLISDKVMTKRHKRHRRPTTPRNSPRHVSSHRTKNIEMLRTNPDTNDTKQDRSFNISHGTESSLAPKSILEPRARPRTDRLLEYSKPDPARPPSRHKSAQIYSEHDAVINVQLANTDLLESLGAFVKSVGMAVKDGSSSYPKSAVRIAPVHTKYTIRPQVRRAQAEIQHENLTASTKSPLLHPTSYESHYRKPDYKFETLSRKGSVEPYIKVIKTKKKYQSRRSANDTSTMLFNDYVVKKINDLETELSYLKQMHDLQSKTNANITVTDQRKDMKENKIVRLSSKNHKLVNKDVIQENNTKSNSKNSESTTNDNTTAKPNAIRNDAINATVNVNRNTSQVTDNVNITNTDDEELHKQDMNITVTSTDSTGQVTKATELGSVVTTPTPVITSTTIEDIEYSTSAYDNYGGHQFDPFDHINDGLDLNM